MLYEVLTRTYLWLYWFVEYHKFEEYTCGNLRKVDGEDSLDWLRGVVFGDSDYTYDYWLYDDL